MMGAGENCDATNSGLPDGFLDQKIAIWVHFGRSSNGRFRVFYGHLAYFTAI
jgi:hypothetical protein